MILWSFLLALFMAALLPSLPHLLPATVGATCPVTAEPFDQSLTVYARKANRRMQSPMKKEAARPKAAVRARVAPLSEYDAAELAEAEAEAEAAIAAALADELEPDPSDRIRPDDSRRPKVKVMNYCHHCGAKLMSSRSVFCNSCGKPLAEVAR